MSSISEKLVEKISTGLGILRWYSIIINRSTQPTLLAFDSALGCCELVVLKVAKFHQNL